MIAQIEREDMEIFREIAPGGLPVPRGAKETMKDDEGRFTGTAQITMKKLHAGR